MKKHVSFSAGALSALLVAVFLSAFALSHASPSIDEKPLDTYGTARTLKKDDFAVLTAKKPKLSADALQLDIEVKSSFKEKKQIALSTLCSALPAHGSADPLATQTANLKAKKGNNKFRFKYSLLPDEAAKFEDVKTNGGQISCRVFLAEGTIDAVSSNNELNVMLEWTDGKLKIVKN